MNINRYDYKKLEQKMSNKQNDQLQMGQLLKSNSILNVFAKSIVNKFQNLYENIHKMKQRVTDQQQLRQLTKIETKIDNLAHKTLEQNQDMKVTAHRNNIQGQIQNLKRQLQQMQRKHQELEQKNYQLQRRIQNIQCNMVSKQQFDQLKQSCNERFSIFEDRFKVMQDSNKNIFVYADQQFKNRIKPSQQFKKKLSELMNKNYRLFEYGKKMYWSLMNHILAYRALSTGAVEKGSIKAKYQSLTLFKELVSVINVATNLISGIPIVNSAFGIIKDLVLIFFQKKQQMVINSMKIRVQGYFTQDQLAEDVARAVLQLLNNPYIQIRISQFQAKSMILSALCKFFQFIANNKQITPELLAQKFFEKLSKARQQKQTKQLKYINQNVMTDTALVIWKMTQNKPQERRYAISEAVKVLFQKNALRQVQYINNNIMGPQINSYGNSNRPSIKAENSQPKFLITSQYNNKNDQTSTNYSASHISYDSSLANSQQYPRQQSSQNPQRINAMRNNFLQISRGASNNVQRPQYFKIKIFRADLTIKKQLFGKLNIYCLIKYGNRIVKTQAFKAADLKPIWNQEFILEANLMTSSITIQLYDKERVMKDQYLGSATILDTQISPCEQQIQLWNQDRSIGKLYIAVHP